MYSDIKSVQIIIAMLKEYNIRNIVISAGNRHTPLARSIDEDGAFNCYSVVDERSAGFFAIGLIKELREPVAICCTSGTAVSNYISPISEAFFSKLPLIALTADRNPYYLYQQEEQMVPQVNIFKDICKKTVTLPFVRDEKDYWYCNRLVNEALSDIERFGDGPVHINYPVETNLFDFNTEKLPKVTKINIVDKENETVWVNKAKELSQYKRILVLYGQALPITNKEEKIIEQFAKKYGAVIAVDYLANFQGSNTLNIYNATRLYYNKIMENLKPEIVISMHGGAVEIHGWLKNCSGEYKYWNIEPNGNIKDPFRCLDTVFKCSEIEFFSKMCEYKKDDCNDTQYYNQWTELVSCVKIPEFEYSDLYAVKQFMDNIPDNTILNLGNSNTVRYAQIFPLKKSVFVYCNRGTNGIDGSVSSFVGQSFVHNGLSFLLIGDLSFFYDMNGIWNRYVGNNVRILLNNNGCGEIFYGNSKQNKETVGKYIAADNNTTAKGWAKTQGFLYLSATNKEEFDENLKQFLSDKSDKPIIFEVFTDKYVNLEQMHHFYRVNQTFSGKQLVKNAIKTIIGKK